MYISAGLAWDITTPCGCILTIFEASTKTHNNKFPACMLLPYTIRDHAIS